MTPKAILQDGDPRQAPPDFVVQTQTAEENPKGFEYGCVVRWNSEHKEYEVFPPWNVGSILAHTHGEWDDVTDPEGAARVEKMVEHFLENRNRMTGGRYPAEGL